MSRKLQESVRKRKGPNGEKGKKEGHVCEKGGDEKGKKERGEKRKRPRVCRREKVSRAGIEKG